MLVALAIRDIVIIDRLSVDFSSGMTVLTGETGAGKSILLDALSLALGARGDASLVRAGAPQGDVTAVFAVGEDHPARALLAAGSLDADGDLILRRVQGADGRSRAFVNDQPVSASLLREIGAALVEIHGQHDDRALIEPSAHRALLDAFGGLGGGSGRPRRRTPAWRRPTAAVAGLEGRDRRGRAESDYLRAAVDELTALAPQPDEEDALADRRAMMMRAEKIAGDVAEAHEIVAGPASPVPVLASLVRRLERKGADGRRPPRRRGRRARPGPGRARGGRAGAQAASPRPRSTRRSWSGPRSACSRSAPRRRKHNVPVADLPALAERMAAELAALESGEERLAALEKTVTAARATYDAKAAALSKQRRRAAQRRLERRSRPSCRR